MVVCYNIHTHCRIFFLYAAEEASGLFINLFKLFGSCFVDSEAKEWKTGVIIIIFLLVCVHLLGVLASIFPIWSSQILQKSFRTVSSR